MYINTITSSLKNIPYQPTYIPNDPLPLDVFCLCTPHAAHFLFTCTHIFSPGESGSGSSLARPVVRGMAVGGERGGGRRGDSRRAWPSPESSESTLTSTCMNTSSQNWALGTL